MSTWHGYPQHPDAHPERPWWRRDGLAAWLRLDGPRLVQGFRCIVARQPQWPKNLEETVWTSDGEASFAEAMAAYDREHPLPPPEPLCGQVWVWPAHSSQRQIVYAEPAGDDRWLVNMGGTPWQYGLNAPTAWPPPGAVLVSGPGAPWADTRGER